MKKGNKKMILLLLLVLGITTILKTTNIYAEEVKTAKTGYHIEYWDDNCASRTVGSIEYHPIVELSSNGITCGSGGGCHAHGAPQLTYGSEKTYGYYCKGASHTTGSSISGSTLHGTCPGCGQGYSCVWPGGASTSSGQTSGTYTCSDHITIEWYCAGHEVANSYTVYYNTTANGSSGSASQSVKYDSGFSLHSGGGFKREWPVIFYGNTDGGSTSGSTQTLISTSPITGWSGGRGLGAYGVWNFTTTHNGSYTLTAQWGSFSAVTVPTVTKTGYTLAGYTSNASKAGVKMNGDTSAVQIRPGDRIVPSSMNEGWYAIWIPNTYTIAFNANDLKYDTTHSTSISGKNYNEYYGTGISNIATTSGTMSNITVQFDGTIQIPTNKYTKTSKGYYGQNVNYHLIGWSQSRFASYNSNSRTSSSSYVRETKPAYYGYYTKTGLRNLAYATYVSGSKTTNAIYFYPNEKINNYMFNGRKYQYNLSTGNQTITLYANWIPENQRPYTYFRLATNQYNEDGTWNGYIQDIAYDSYPTSIYDYNDNPTTIYNDMPIYLDTIYYDPEGRVDDGQFTIEYQYSLDGGTTWYQLLPNITTPNFKTSLVTMNTTNLANSKNLDGSYVVDNTKSRNIIFGNNNTNNATTTYMLQINFVGEEHGKTTLIRSRAADTVDYPIMLTNVTRNETTNQVSTSTNTTLQKTLWSTGYYSKSYSSDVNGVVVNEYTGTANSWNGQKSFVQNTSVGKTSGDNAGWYTKTITCYLGNSSNPDDDPTIDDSVVADFDNLGNYPLYDYTKGRLFIMLSDNVEQKNKIDYGTVDISNVLKYRGYVKTLKDGSVMDWTTKYSSITTLIRESKKNVSGENNLNRKYSDYAPADESIGFINISVDKDNYKHYTPSANPTYNIDNSYIDKYYHTGDSTSKVTYNNQFSLYFLAIYDNVGNEVITQAGGTSVAAFDSKGIPVNGTKYTMPKSRTGLSMDLNGHIYTTYDNMVNDIYNKVGALFAEESDLMNGTYTVYIGVCDKSWNLYSPNKWAIEKSTLIVEPRLSFIDIDFADFKQPKYKNKYVLNANGQETSTKIPSSVFIKSLKGNKVTVVDGGKTYKVPMYKISGYNTTKVINGYTLYATNHNLTQKEQAKQANTDYAINSVVGYDTPIGFKLQYGYNFDMNIETQNADYIEIVFYGSDNKVIAPVVDLKEYIGDTDKSLKYNTIRDEHIEKFGLTFPEQTNVSGIYAKVYIYKTTITNTNHPTSTGNGNTSLIRVIQVGSASNPIIDKYGTLLDDIGVNLRN